MTETKSSALRFIYAVLAIIISYLGINYDIFTIFSILVVPIIISVIIYDYGMWDAIYSGMSIIIFNSISVYFVRNGMILGTLIYSLFIIIAGVIIGINYIKKLSFQTLIINMGIYYTLCIMGLFAFVKFFMKVDVTGALRVYFIGIYTVFSEVLEIYYPHMLNNITIPEYELYNTFYSILPGMVPFFTITSGVILSLVQYALSKLFLNSDFIKKSNFSDGFDKFRLSIVTAVFFLITFLLNNSNIDYKLSMVAVNIFLIIVVLYIIESSSVLYYFLKKSIMSRMARLALFAVIAFISIGIGAFLPVNIFYIFVLVGLTDSIFNYRKLGENSNEEDE